MLNGVNPDMFEIQRATCLLAGILRATKKLQELEPLVNA